MKKCDADISLDSYLARNVNYHYNNLTTPPLRELRCIRDNKVGNNHLTRDPLGKKETDYPENLLPPGRRQEKERTRSTRSSKGVRVRVHNTTFETILPVNEH